MLFNNIGGIVDAKMFIVEAARSCGISPQALHKKLKYHDIKAKKLSNKSYIGFNEARKIFNLKFEPRVVGCQIVKGGVGKTTLVGNLAIRANLYGARVLLIDLDQQANLTESMNIDAQDNPVMIDVVCGEASVEEAIMEVTDGIDIIPSAIENSVLDTKLRDENYPLDRVYKKHIDQVKDAYDVILIDCPPALGPSVGAVALSSDLILAPINPDRYSLSGLRIIHEQFSELERKFDREIDFKIVLNKFSSTTLSKHVYDGIYNHEVFRDKLMSVQVLERQEFKNKDATKGKTIFSTSRETESKENIDRLTRELFNLNDQLTGTENRIKRENTVEL